MQRRVLNCYLYSHCAGWHIWNPWTAALRCDQASCVAMFAMSAQPAVCYTILSVTDPVHRHCWQLGSGVGCAYADWEGLVATMVAKGHWQLTQGHSVLCKWMYHVMSRTELAGIGLYGSQTDSWRARENGLAEITPDPALIIPITVHKTNSECKHCFQTAGSCACLRRAVSSWGCRSEQLPPSLSSSQSNEFMTG